MYWLDALVILVMGASAALAFMRGFVREVMGVAAWVVAIVAAFLFYHPLGQQVAQWTGAKGLAAPLAFGGIFLVTLVVLSLIAAWFGKVVQVSALGGVDRVLGLVFGLIRGGLLLCAAYLLAGMAVPQKEWPGAVLKARSLPYLYEGANWLARQVPKTYRPAVLAPPGITAANNGTATPATPAQPAPTVVTPAPAQPAPAQTTPAQPAPTPPAPAQPAPNVPAQPAPATTTSPGQ